MERVRWGAPSATLLIALRSAAVLGLFANGGLHGPGAAAAAANPLAAGPPLDQLIAWYDAADDAGLQLAGGKVAIWKDKSGNGHDAASTDAGRPERIVEGGMPVINAAGHPLQSAPMTGTYKSLTFHALVCAAPGYHPLLTLTTTGKTEFFDGGWTIGSQPGIFSKSGLTCGQQELEDSRWHILSMVRDGAARAFYVDGVPAGTGVSKDEAVDITQLELFRFQGAATYQGRAAEMLLYGAAQSPGDLQATLAYLSGKWAPLLPPVTAPVIAFVGNSLSTGMYCGNGKTWSAQTARLLGEIPRWFNVSKGGVTTQGLAASAPQQVDPLLRKGSGKKILLFWEGTNELVVNKATPEAASEAIADYCRARRAAGWAKIAVLTVMPREAGADFEPRRIALNALIKGHYHEYADALIDVAADADLGAEGANHNKAIFSDGTHLSAAGNARVAAMAAPVLKALLAAP